MTTYIVLWDDDDGDYGHDDGIKPRANMKKGSKRATERELCSIALLGSEIIICVKVRARALHFITYYNA